MSNATTGTQKFGIIGLEVMGKNLALNVERNGFPIAVYNRTTSKTEEFVAENPGKQIKMGATYEEFVGLLETPRRILIMVKAGKPVDYVMNDLKPLLEPGDLVIDGGNSLYTDTERRAKEYEQAGLSFFGMGVSGGEEGALWGPSLMPGGTEKSYEDVEPILQKIAAKAPEDGKPCVTYLGRGGSGHFVKMVHNGIEYGDMQLIAESYDLLKRVGGLSNDELHEVFAQWNNGDDLKSFLIEITVDIFAYGKPHGEDPAEKDGGDKDLVDLIMDEAKAKGTGAWTVQAAAELGVAIPTITAAVDARSISSLKTQRERADGELTGPKPKLNSADKKQLTNDVRHALYCSKMCSYAQGFALLRAADHSLSFGLHMKEIAGIWRAGCIIRAVFLNDITATMTEQPDLPNLLLAERFKAAINEREPAWRRIVRLAFEQGVPVPGFSASLAYYDSYRTARLPANLIQAQRDYFGAHTYVRTDIDGVYHTQWSPGAATEANPSANCNDSKADPGEGPKN